MSYALTKPYTENERIKFIAKYNHKNGLAIEETEKALFALEANEIIKNGKPCVDEEYEERIFKSAKEEKLQNCLKKAFEAEENGTILYKEAVFETNSTNISKLTAMLSMIEAGIIESVQWLSKDDIQIELKKEDMLAIGQLIAEYTGALWNVQYLALKERIEDAETIQELNEIEIEY